MPIRLLFPIPIASFLLPIPPASRSPLPSSRLPLITYFPKINMHCELRSEAHLRGAADWWLGWLCGYRTTISSATTNTAAVALAMAGDGSAAAAADVDVDAFVIVNRSNGLHEQINEANVRDSRN